MGSQGDVRVELVTKADDIARCFEIAAKIFGTQTADNIWMAWNPGWNTPEGKAAGISRMKRHWATATVDQAGNLNTIYLKATVLTDEGEVIAGMAVWLQGSIVPGYGDAPEADLVKALDLDTLYPGDASAHRYICQLTESLFKQRNECIIEAASRSPPAIMIADTCGVDPAFRGRGIGSKLTQRGLDEAVRRGGLESVMEASVAGRPVWSQLGFKQDGPEIEYHLDDEFRDRRLPSNFFMRTGRPRNVKL